MGLKVAISGVVARVMSQRFVASAAGVLGVVPSERTPHLQLGGPQCHHPQLCGPVGSHQASSQQRFQPLLPHPCTCRDLLPRIPVGMTAPALVVELFGHFSVGLGASFCHPERGPAAEAALHSHGSLLWCFGGADPRFPLGKSGISSHVGMVSSPRQLKGAGSSAELRTQVMLPLLSAL